MSQPSPLVDRTVPLRLLKWQLTLGACVAVVVTFSVSRLAGLSVGLGAGIAVAGNLYFVLRAFRYAGAASAQKIVQSFYRGEAGKFFITVLLFAVVFVRFKASVHVGWLLTGFILEQLVGWVVPFLGARHER